MGNTSRDGFSFFSTPRFLFFCWRRIYITRFRFSYAVVSIQISVFLLSILLPSIPFFCFSPILSYSLSLEGKKCKNVIILIFNKFIFVYINSCFFVCCAYAPIHYYYLCSFSPILCLCHPWDTRRPTNPCSAKHRLYTILWDVYSLPFSHN